MARGAGGANIPQGATPAAGKYSNKYQPKDKNGRLIMPTSEQQQAFYNAGKLSPVPGEKHERPSSKGSDGSTAFDNPRPRKEPSLKTDRVIPAAAEQRQLDVEPMQTEAAGADIAVEKSEAEKLAERKDQLQDIIATFNDTAVGQGRRFKSRVKNVHPKAEALVAKLDGIMKIIGSEDISNGQQLKNTLTQFLKLNHQTIETLKDGRKKAPTEKLVEDLELMIEVLEQDVSVADGYSPKELELAKAWGLEPSELDPTILDTLNAFGKEPKGALRRPESGFYAVARDPAKHPQDDGANAGLSIPNDPEYDIPQ